MSVPLAIVNFKATSRPVATIRYFADPKKVTAMYDGLDTGVARGSARQLANLLLAYHHDPKASRVCRTALISVKTGKGATETELKDIDRRLLRAAADLQNFLGVASMLGWVHGNTATRHIHLIFANSNGRRTLDLRPQFLKEIQSLMWTVQFVAGRGKGYRKALPMYPRAKRLDTRILAVMLFNTDGSVRRERWNKLVASGKITGFRTRKNGSLISFQFQGRRIRVATLQNFLAELAVQNNPNPNMTNIIDPETPLPPETEKSLNESGFTSEDVQEVLTDIRSALKVVAPTSPTPSTKTPSINL